MRKKTWLLLAFVIMAFSGYARAEAVIGQRAPLLTGEKLDGQKFALADMKGEVVAVHFWATWCEACQQEMPALDAFYRKHRGQGVEVIAISADKSRARAEVSDAMKAFSFPAAMMSDFSTNGFGGPAAIPVTYIIDRSGIVRAILMPRETPFTEQDFSGFILPLMKNGAK